MKKLKSKIKAKLLLGTVLFALAGSALVFTAAKSSEDPYFQIAKNIDIFTTLYKQVNTYYVDETKPGTLMKKAIDAMLKSLDPYTVFYPESDIEDFKFMTTGQYGGIGAMIRTSQDHVIIAEPYEDFPAFNAGLRAGDKIITADGDTAIGKTSSEMSKILKGQPGTELELVIERPYHEGLMTFTVTREDVKIDNVPYYGEIAPKVGYIHLSGFTEDAGKNVKDALLELKEENNIESLVLDLRGNGGGLLREAVNIVNLFVPKGVEVVNTKGQNEDWNRSHQTINKPVDLEIPLVVLIDGSSASASEIVSGSMQDLDRGVVIGQTSFGKGLVQQTKDLSYNSKMKITVAKYYIPSGRCIQKLDYSAKDEFGNAKPVPDSLKGEFTTKNGRKVYDGDGIEPDIIIEQDKPSPILSVLVRQNLIFDYATLYRYEHDSIPPAKEFAMTDEDYKRFKAFLEDKEYDYTTKTEEMLEKLQKATKKEQYYERLEEAYAALKKEIYHNKDQDLITFKDQILPVVENEIVSRYYYQRGRILNSLNNDEEIEKAIEVLTQNELYTGILTKKD